MGGMEERKGEEKGWKRKGRKGDGRKGKERVRKETGEGKRGEERFILQDKNAILTTFSHLGVAVFGNGYKSLFVWHNMKVGWSLMACSTWVHYSVLIVRGNRIHIAGNSEGAIDNSILYILFTHVLILQSDIQQLWLLLHKIIRN